jgi:mono/diheme cytochrome c family protein
MLIAFGALSLFVSVANAQEPAAQSGGQTLYEQLCASCHGAEGRGDGAASSDVLLRPRDFALNAFKFDTDADWERGSDVDLANVIKNGPAVYGGSALMPPWSTLSDDDIAALVAHIRLLQQRVP